MRNSTNIFLVNLSVADLCVLVICTPTILIEVNSGPEVWPLGEHMCKSESIVRKSMTHFHVSIPIISATRHKHDTMICLANWQTSICQPKIPNAIYFLQWTGKERTRIISFPFCAWFVNMHISIASRRLEWANSRLEPTGISTHYRTNVNTVNTTSADRSSFFKMLVCARS